MFANFGELHIRKNDKTAGVRNTDVKENREDEMGRKKKERFGARQGG